MLRSGWMTTPTIGTTAHTFALLHQVCTGISEKVQTRMLAITAEIVVLERYVQRYILIRVLICTIYRERRACLLGRVTYPWVSVKSAVVQTYRAFRKISGRSGNRLHLKGFRGAKLGAKVCKRVQMCKRMPRSTPPLAPGGAQTPVLETRRVFRTPFLRNIIKILEKKGSGDRE